MGIEQTITELQKVSAEQTAASQALSQEVAGKMGVIDKKVGDAINRSETNYEEKKSELTVIATDGYRKAIEHNSGGRNTVIYDKQGNPNIMCVIPRFNIEDLGLTDLKLGRGTHTAFVTNGVPRSEVLIGKYLASGGIGGGSAVIGGVQPRTSVDYDGAKAACTMKGDGWHLMSVHEWAAIALWSLANKTVPRGNTNYGRSHENKMETARRADNGQPGDVSGTARTAAGKGPATWGHDHSEFGIQDLVGNVWEWQDQMMLRNGQIITTLDNNPALAEAAWQKHPAYFDSPNANQSGDVGSPILNSSVVNRNGPINDDSHNYGYASNTHFAAITKDGSYTPNELLRQLLIESETKTVAGQLYARNYGSRFPSRGGFWGYGSNCGLGALYLGYARSLALSVIGFRPAFFGS